MARAGIPFAWYPACLVLGLLWVDLSVGISRFWNSVLVYRLRFFSFFGRRLIFFVREPSPRCPPQCTRRFLNACIVKWLKFFNIFGRRLILFVKEPSPRCPPKRIRHFLGLLRIVWLRFFNNLGWCLGGFVTRKLRLGRFLQPARVNIFHLGLNRLFIFLVTDD
ncbi:hypothetical protein MKX07_002874 [Trichoderma sp. CBMAI-0711]|nr:hypothetical protein MKX07_002874 [Trichoderma sp. CBMAI-0711]